MSTFQPRVHDGYILGTDRAFGNFSPDVACAGEDCRATVVPPSQVHPATGTACREAEMRYYDEVAAAVFAELHPTTAAAAADDASSYNRYDFREVVLITDVNIDSTAGSSSAAGSRGQHDPRRPWRGSVFEQKAGHDGSRYFIPACMLESGGGRRANISLYHYAQQTQLGGNNIGAYTGLKDYRHLYAGRVVGIVGTVIQRDSVTNDVIGVAVESVVLPKAPAPQSLVAAPPPPPRSSAHPNPFQQRVHFVPIPVYNDGQAQQLEHFLTDVIHYLGCVRGSSLVVFAGCLSPDPKASDGKASFDRMSMLAVEKAQQVSEDLQTTLRQRAALARQWGQPAAAAAAAAASSGGALPAHFAVPIAFVPHVDDITMTPPMVPQVGASTLFARRHDYTETARLIAEAKERAFEDDEEAEQQAESGAAKKTTPALAAALDKNRLGVATHLAGNPGELVLGSGTLRVVATSVDLQSALASHAATAPLTIATASRTPSSWRLRMAGLTLRESMLLAPYIHGGDEYAVEPTALPELRRASAKTAPHIFFTPTSVFNGPQAAFCHGTLFLSCHATPAAAVRMAAATSNNKFNGVGLGPQSLEPFQVMEVDVANSRLALSEDNVRVKCIEFVRKAN